MKRKDAEDVERRKGDDFPGRYAPLRFELNHMNWQRLTFNPVHRRGAGHGS
jgi:hypothetical protein